MDTTARFRINVNRSMKTQNVSQVELAKRTGVTRPHLNRVLNGVNLPSLELAAKIAEAIGVPLSDLVATRQSVAS